MKQIESMTDCESPIVTRRASTAIFLALKAWDSRGIFVVPSNICQSPIMAGLIAGYEIVYASTKGFGVDLNHVERLIDENPNVRAVLIPELYGYPITFSQRILKKMHDKKILLIEDLAQSIGPSRIERGFHRPLKVTIYSFGKTKHFTEFDAGVMSVQDRDFRKRIFSLLNELQVMREFNYRSLRKQYSVLYAEFLERGEKERDWAVFFQKVAKFPSSFFVANTDYRVPSLSRNIVDFDYIKLKNSRHLRILEVFATLDQVQLPSHKHLKWPIWRTTLRLNQTMKHSLIECLNQEGMPISSWYKAMHKHLPMLNHGDDRLREAAQFEKSVVNLVISQASKHDFEKYFARIARWSEGFNR